MVPGWSFLLSAAARRHKCIQVARGVHLELVLLPKHSENLANRRGLIIAQLLCIWVHVALAQVQCEMLLPEFAAEGWDAHQGVDIPLLD